MPRRSAIDIAIEARRRGGFGPPLPAGALPADLKSLLRIVAEGEWRDAGTEHVYATHGAREVRAASAAFLVDTLFRRPGDPYRVLGLSPGASTEEVRDNKRLLLKWLHPDRNADPIERGYLAQVLEAAAAIEQGRVPPGAARQPKPPSIVMPARPRVRPPARRRAGLRWLAAGAAGRVAGLARFAAAAALVTLTSLVAWRYMMDEPIGTSIERYARLAEGMLPW